MEVWGLLAPADIPSPATIFFQLLNLSHTMSGLVCVCTWTLRALCLSPTESCFLATPWHMHTTVVWFVLRTDLGKMPKWVLEMGFGLFGQGIPGFQGCTYPGYCQSVGSELPTRLCSLGKSVAEGQPEMGSLKYRA